MGDAGERCSEQALDEEDESERPHRGSPRETADGDEDRDVRNAAGRGRDQRWTSARRTPRDQRGESRCGRDRDESDQAAADPSPDNGVIEAACAAGIDAIGAGVDRAVADPAAKACILTSAEDRISTSVADTVVAIEHGTATGGAIVFDASDGGVGLAPFYDAADRLPADLPARLEAATADIAAGRIATCPPPPDCGRVGAPID